MEFLLDPNLWIAFAMLTALEIVLGIDNIIFISILVGRLPADVRDKARRLGLGFAMVSRLLLLFSLSWVMSLKTDLFHIFFSLDSVITAVGMVDQIGVMVAAVITSVGVMLFAAKPIGDFVDAHPSVKVLALAFLVMVGMALTAEALDAHVPKGYIYAAMSFSLAVEFLNIRSRTKRLALQKASQA